jgi:hypothetical protein
LDLIGLGFSLCREQQARSGKASEGLNLRAPKTKHKLVRKMQKNAEMKMGKMQVQFTNQNLQVTLKQITWLYSPMKEGH